MDKAIEAAARALYENDWKDAIPCPWGSCSVDEQKYWTDSAQACISAYLAASGDGEDAARLDKMQEIFVKGEDVHIVMCQNRLEDSEHECEHETHPHFEAFNWMWRCEPVRANTLRDVIDAAIAVDAARG